MRVESRPSASVAFSTSNQREDLDALVTRLDDAISLHREPNVGTRAFSLGVVPWHGARGSRRTCLCEPESCLFLPAAHRADIGSDWSCNRAWLQVAPHTDAGAMTHRISDGEAKPQVSDSETRASFPSGLPRSALGTERSGARMPWQLRWSDDRHWARNATGALARSGGCSAVAARFCGSRLCGPEGLATIRKSRRHVQERGNSPLLAFP